MDDDDEWRAFADFLSCDALDDASLAATAPAQRKGAWAESEDARLRAEVGAAGPARWRGIASKIDGRSAKQARRPVPAAHGPGAAL